MGASCGTPSVNQGDGEVKVLLGSSGVAQDHAEKIGELPLWAKAALEDLPRYDRLILISDNLPNFEMLIRATNDTTLVVPVQYASWSLKVLVEQIAGRAGLPCQQFKSVALLDHGKPGEFCLLKEVAGGSVELKEIKESLDLQGFLKHLAGYVQEPLELHNWKNDKDSRIDLMGCCVAQGKDGAALIDYLEELTKVNWCASTDKTGAGHEAEDGFDWVMESDPNVGCVADAYFHKDKLIQWQHTAWNPVGFVADVGKGIVDVGVSGVKGVAKGVEGGAHIVHGVATGDGNKIKQGVYKVGDGASAAAGSALMVASGPAALTMAVACETAIQNLLDSIPAGKEVQKVRKLKGLLSKARAAKKGDVKAAWDLLREVQQNGIRVPGF